MTTEQIREALFAERDGAYAAFLLRLTPGMTPDRIIGVRTPILRKLAKQWAKTGEAEDFLNDLPHRYYEEGNLHGFLISEEPDFGKAVEKVDAFLPYVDNWATCDQTSPKVFRKHRAELKPHIDRWISSEHIYTVRFGIEMAMSHFLDTDFDPSFPAKIAAIRREAYYVKMMQAWYFATALAKQWDAALPYLVNGLPDPWVQNKTVQKAIESDRITPEQKIYLKTLKVGKGEDLK